MNMGKHALMICAVMALLCGCQADDETPPTEQMSPQETAVVSTSTPTPAEEVRTLTREEYEEWMHERSAVDGKLCISRSDDEYLKALPQDEPHSFEITYDPFYLTCEEYREIYGEILSLMKKQSELVYRTQAELIAAGENGSATLDSDAMAWHEANDSKLPQEYWDARDKINALNAELADIIETVQRDNCIKTAGAFSALGCEAAVMRYDEEKGDRFDYAQMTGQCYMCIVQATPGQLCAIGEKLDEAYMLRLLDDGIGTENMKLFTIKVWPEE